MKFNSNFMLSNVFFDEINKMFNRMIDFFKESGITIVKVIFFFFIGLFAIRIVIKILRKILFKTKLEHAVSNYLLTIIKIILFFVLTLSLLKTLGVDTTSFVAVITTLSLALSLAMETIFTNLANGLVIIMTKPFKEGDWISINGYEGSVKAINLLNTILTTTDNKDINIPNSHFVGNELINYNANLTRKLIMSFDSAYDSDVDKVKSVIKRCIYCNDHAILDPEPIIRLQALEASSIKFQVIVHCKTSDYWSLYYELIDSVFNEFKRENIGIPFNQLEVRLLTNESLSPYRQEELCTRSNDGKYSQNQNNEDIIDKLTDSVNIVKQVKKFTKLKKNNNTDTNKEKFENKKI